MIIGQPTLDQLRILVGVVDAGSFAAGARQLGRAVSVISYGIGQLEAQLGVTLFDRANPRRPQLTPAGRALLADARAVLAEADTLMARARAIGQGIETEVALAVDVMVPLQRVAGVLRSFQQAFPLTDLRLHVEALGAVAGLVLDGQAHLAIAGPDLLDLPELARQEVGAVELVPVAAPDHPLARRGSMAPGDAQQYLQLVLTDRSPLTRGRDFSVLSPRTWRLADLGAKHALLLEGSGWGNMPRHLVEDDLRAGRLCRLPLPEGETVPYRLHALWRKDCTPGPATAWLLDALGEVLRA
ncbi:LysR family transcriptional regulator [Erythrobacteraceae bacterium CFH 75059]|nr:LysR family transcriptional regulator [Qipengyuania thermophila]TCD02108.1 LysR family transcriptional regulator [Erythrobacteraceae bacterium CFH 75059]